jgi:hypothetical protein
MEEKEPGGNPSWSTEQLGEDEKFDFSFTFDQGDYYPSEDVPVSSTGFRHLIPCHGNHPE